MALKIKLIIIFLFAVVCIIFLTKYLYKDNQKSSRADTLPSIVLQLAYGDSQNIIKIKAKTTTNAAQIINYNFNIVLNSNSQVTDINYVFGRKSEGLGDGNDTLTTVNSNRLIKINSDVEPPSPLSTTFQDMVTISFNNAQTGNMLSIPVDSLFAFTAYNSTTGISNTLAITGGPFTLSGGSSSSSSSSVQSSSNSSVVSSSSSSFQSSLSSSSQSGGLPNLIVSEISVSDNPDDPEFKRINYSIKNNSNVSVPTWNVDRSIVFTISLFINPPNNPPSITTGPLVLQNYNLLATPLGPNEIGNGYFLVRNNGLRVNDIIYVWVDRPTTNYPKGFIIESSENDNYKRYDYISSQNSSSSSSRQSSSSSAARSSSSSSRQSSSSVAASSSSSSRVTSSSSSSYGTTPQLSAVQIALKLRFQGIIGSPEDTTPLNVKVSLVREGDEQNGFVESAFLAGSDGTYKGKIGIDPVDYNAKYYIYVKGPKHLQKKFCDVLPQLNAQGFYSCSKAKITLHSGQNDFDFSNIKLFSGDLPEQNNMQNGIIDAYDLSFIRSSIANGEYHYECDFNQDKKCQWQDWSLVLASMAEKYDE